MPNIIEPNGEVRAPKTSDPPDLLKSALFVGYDPVTQAVSLFHDNKQAKTWDFVRMLLVGAMSVADFNLRMAQNQAVAQAQAEQMRQAGAQQQQVALAQALARRGHS